MPIVTPRITVDATGLNTMINAARKYSRRTPARAVNMAGGWVAYAWLHAMPAVPVAKIDTELAVSVSVRIGARGKPLSAKYARNRILSGGVGPSFKPPVPFAALIVSARARPGSRYNQLTNNRFALAVNPFKGVSRAAGAAAMRAAVHRMIASRHSSTAFLKSAVGAVYRQMLPYLRGYTPGPPPSGGVTGVPKGSAIPAVEGKLTAVCVLSADIGLVNAAQGAQGEKYNAALWRYGAPPLQYAVDLEARRQFEYHARKAFQVEVAEPMRALGIAR